jgi:chaperonin GroEL (HSP60 family)
MSSINEILLKVKHGDQYVKTENIKKTILENYDTETNLLFSSQRIDDIRKSMFFEENSIVARNIEKAKVKLENAETRLYDGKILTEAYKRMTSSGLIQDYNTIIESLNSKIEYNKFSDKEKLGRILATIKYATKEYINPSATFKESVNPSFNAIIKEEFNSINDVI